MHIYQYTCTIKINHSMYKLENKTIDLIISTTLGTTNTNTKFSKLYNIQKLDAKLLDYVQLFKQLHKYGMS